MAMSKTVLGAALWANVKATQTFSPAISSGDDAKGLALWTTIADAIITEITTHGVVNHGTFVDSVTSAPISGSGTIS